MPAQGKVRARVAMSSRTTAISTNSKDSISAAVGGDVAAEVHTTKAMAMLVAVAVAAAMRAMQHLGRACMTMSRSLITTREVDVVVFETEVVTSKVNPPRTPTMHPRPTLLPAPRTQANLVPIIVAAAEEAAVAFTLTVASRTTVEHLVPITLLIKE